MNKIKGTGVALVTCFNEDKSIDYIGLKKLLQYVSEGGVDYLVVMGTTGESVTINEEERIQVLKFIQDNNPLRLPIVLGLGANNTSALIDEIKKIDFSGIDAILSVSPYYNKPAQEGIYQHYKKLSKYSPIPIIIYNVPSRTGTNICSQTTLRLACDFDNIIAIKEASGNLDQIMSIIKDKPKDFVVLSGDDAFTLPMIYLGAEGVISVIGQLHPTEYSQMVNAAISGDIAKANQLHYSLYNYYGPLYREGNPSGIKAALETIGICKRFVRLPLIEASEPLIQELVDLRGNNLR